MDEWPYDGDDYIKDPWPYKLARELDADLINLSNEGKDNRQIFNDTISFLSDPNQPNPNFLVVQWTELYRLCLFKKRHTNNWRSLQRPYNNKFALPHWIKIAPRQDLDGSSNAEKFREIVVHDKNNTQKKVTIFSDGYDVEKTELIHMTYALQEVCKSKNIKVCFINFFECQLDEMWWNRVDANSQLIANNEVGMGWFNHLLWEGYEPYWHGHFKEDAQQYTADRLKSFFIDGERVFVERIQPPDKPIPIHTYTSEE